jgi:hypothetical protein
MRSDQKPLRIESSSSGRFRTRANRSYQRVSGCYCASARADDSGGPASRDSPKERRRKTRQNERSYREGHAVSAGPVKTFRKAGDVKNGTAGLRTKSNLRVKRRDPWHWANAPSKAVADPVRSGQDAEKNSQTCLGLVCRPVAQPPAQAS